MSINTDSVTLSKVLLNSNLYLLREYFDTHEAEIGLTKIITIKNLHLRVFSIYRTLLLLKPTSLLRKYFNTHQNILTLTVEPKFT